MKDHWSTCLGTFTPKNARKIKRLIYQGGESRTINIIFRGRGRNTTAKSINNFWWIYRHGVPLKYATHYALYLRTRPKILTEEKLAQTIIGINNFKGKIPLVEITRVIKALTKKGYSAKKIAKTLKGG